MAPDWIKRLLADTHAPMDTIKPTVYSESLDAVINALFDEGVRVQYRDPERALACVKLIDRIQAHTKPGSHDRTISLRRPAGGRQRWQPPPRSRPMDAYGMPNMARHRARCGAIRGGVRVGVGRRAASPA